MFSSFRLDATVKCKEYIQYCTATRSRSIVGLLDRPNCRSVREEFLKILLPLSFSHNVSCKRVQQIFNILPAIVNLLNLGPALALSVPYTSIHKQRRYDAFFDFKVVTIRLFFSSSSLISSFFFVAFACSRFK